MTKTKILIAIMSMEIGGAETHVLELCKALQKKGMQVYVASNGGAYEPELTECGVIHYKVPLHNKQPFNIIDAYKALKKIIVTHDIRLVHAHARIPAFICGFLQLQLNFRFVTTAHWVFTTKFPYNLLSNWGEKSLAVSEDIKEYLIEHYKVPKENIYVTINGVDTEKFSPLAEKAIKPPEIERPGRKDFCIMFTARMDKDRSLAAHLLIESAPTLCSRYKGLTIYLIGGGDDFDAVNARATSMNEQIGYEAIILTGARVDIHKWLAMADVFVGASRSVLEAMSASKPVVAAGNEGYMGLINEENLQTAIATNFCYRGCGEANAEQLAADIITILDMPAEKRESMGKFGREFILKNYSVDKMAEDAILMYNTVLKTACPVPVSKTDILVSGYYGYNNSGDDLLLKSIVQDLKKRREDIIITVLSMRPKETKAEYGVNAIYRFNFLTIFWLMRNTKLLLTGGGSVIQDLTSTHSLIYYLGIIRLARRLGVANMLYANGIGPIRNAKNVERMRQELSQIELITLREEPSKILLDELNITEPKIIVTADPAFSLPQPDLAGAREELAEIGIDINRFFCIAIRSWRYNPPGFELNIARFADYMARENKYQVLFVPMRPSDDTEISKRVMGLMSSPAKLLENPRNIDSIRGIVALSTFTVAMRLHTLIYAINQGIPVIGLVYDPKVQWLMDSIKQPFYITVENVRMDILIDFANKILANYDDIAKAVKAAGEIAQNLAEQNADLCLELLDSRD
ncbi:MAG: polysaccharide pyruvyl transferase CsaB [Defluviitaleaceae bacterium]|nr:polysaccharide pyruvyl transferase CsaB [Defluviitaleaceae bacterium]